ncbi:MAG TPA: aminotransferase class V-fold PLP-dependent enzyme [Bryobacteraceae bacterium]|nr:aminotransferase class V-fold PLP-dependent enzyme [Bryobacteraceae bacterium]
MKRKTVTGMDRRSVILTAGAGLAAQFLTPAPARAAQAVTDHATEVYTRIGVRPFITLTATSTVNGGGLTLPEVKSAMEAASLHSVNIDELMDKAGKRIATLLGAESAIVTSGASSALTNATAACVAGADPEAIQLLPRLAGTGLKDEVIMPRYARNPYDHAIRTVGVKIISVDTLDELRRAIGKQTAMIALVGSHGMKIPLESIVPLARKAGVPVVVDGAPEFPKVPNTYLSGGADLVAYSGGKILMGPQCSGILMGRRDLVAAAWVNSSPHDGLGRTMKVGKEEIMGLLAAVEALIQRRHPAEEQRQWVTQLSQIDQIVSRVPDVRTKHVPPPGTNPHPGLQIEWDPAKIDMTLGELQDELLKGEPRLKVNADGPEREGHSVLVHAAGIRPGQENLVADRIRDVLQQAARKGKRPNPAPPAEQLAGTWEVDVRFARGAAQHRLVLESNGNRISGWHYGRDAKGALSGTISGERVRFRSVLPLAAVQFPYTFTGKISRGKMSGDLEYYEHSRAQWTATKHV